MARLTAPIREWLRAVRMLRPLPRRDFSLLTIGSVVSLLGVRDPERRRDAPAAVVEPGAG